MPPTSNRNYAPSKFRIYAVAADVVLFTIEDNALKVLLIRRGEEPFRGAWALPGGFVRKGENLDQAAGRELTEETGLTEADCHLEQLASYGDPERDPRKWVVTVAYWAVCAGLPKAQAGGDAAATEWVSVERIENEEISLAFDHRQILRDALERLCAKMEYTALAAKFLPPVFSVGELRRVYELVWSKTLDPGNFQRSFRQSGAFKRKPHQSQAARAGRGRPASLWSLKEPRNPSMTPLRRPIAQRSSV